MDINLILTLFFGILTIIGILLAILFPPINNVIDTLDDFNSACEYEGKLKNLTTEQIQELKKEIVNLGEVRNFYYARIRYRKQNTYIVLTRKFLDICCWFICLKIKIQIFNVKTAMKLANLRFRTFNYEIWKIRKEHKKELQKRIKLKRKSEFDEIMKWYENGCPK